MKELTRGFIQTLLEDAHIVANEQGEIWDGVVFPEKEFNNLKDVLTQIAWDHDLVDTKKEGSRLYIHLLFDNTRNPRTPYLVDYSRYSVEVSYDKGLLSLALCYSKQCVIIELEGKFEYV